MLRFLQQRERFIAALVRPLVWLFIFAAGFRSVLGVSIIPPYQTYVLYEEYITPGLIGMIQLFSGMQTSLSMVYDREMGSMRILLTSPAPRWFLLVNKLLAGTVISILQVYVFLAIRLVLGNTPPYRRLSNTITNAYIDRIYAQCYRIVHIVGNQAVGKFCRNYEFRYIPNVLRFFRALSIMAY